MAITIDGPVICNTAMMTKIIKYSKRDLDLLQLKHDAQTHRLAEVTSLCVQLNESRSKKSTMRSNRTSNNHSPADTGNIGKIVNCTSCGESRERNLKTLV